MLILLRRFRSLETRHQETFDEAVAPVTFGYTSSDPFDRGGTSERVFIKLANCLQNRLGKDLRFITRRRRKIGRIGSNNSRLDTQWECELAGNCPPNPTGGSGNRTYLQSTTQWFALHGNRTLNMLMADGSVRSFADLNKDGYLNPGFAIPSNLTDAQYAQLGYRDNTVELPLPPSAMFCGVFLSPQRIKGSFE